MKFIKDVFSNVESVVKPNQDHEFVVVLHMTKKQQDCEQLRQINAWDIDYRNWYLQAEDILTLPQFRKMFKEYVPRDGKGEKWKPFRLHRCVFIDPTPSNTVSPASESEGQISYFDDLQGLELILSECLSLNTSDSESISESFGVPDAWEAADSICSSIMSMSIIPNLTNRLTMLDNTLRGYHEQGVSKKQIKAAVRRRGICLKNCAEYGSAWKLTRALRYK